MFQVPALGDWSYWRVRFCMIITESESCGCSWWYRWMYSHVQVTPAAGKDFVSVWVEGPGSLLPAGSCRPTSCYQWWLLYCYLNLQCKSTSSSLPSIAFPATLTCTAKIFFYFQIERITVDLREISQLEPGEHSVNIFTYAIVPKERKESSLIRLNS